MSELVLNPSADENKIYLAADEVNILNRLVFIFLEQAEPRVKNNRTSPSPSPSATGRQA